MTTLRTARLVLRPWRDADLAPFAALNADPEVMAHYPATLDRAQSDALATQLRASLNARGYGLWAVELLGIAPFAGYVGLATPSFEAPFTPCVEVGWRLARAFWSRGLASEAAAASLDHGFGALGLAEVVSFTVPANRRSVAVMERLGMRRSPAEDFLHPNLPDGHPLRPHLLYRLNAADWARKSRGDCPRATAVSAIDTTTRPSRVNCGRTPPL